MKKLFLIPLLACFFCIGAYADGNVARIGNTEYATVNDAIAAAPNNTETQIDLIKDVVTPAVIEIPAEKNIILNLNSFGVSTDYPGNAQATIYENCVLYNKGTLHIITKGESIVQNASRGGDAAVIGNTGTLTIDGGIFLGALAHSDMGYWINAAVIWSENNSAPITINGGVFLQAANYPEYSMVTIDGVTDMYISPWKQPLQGTAVWTINGGIFSGDINAKLDTENYASESISYSNAQVPGYTSTKTVYTVHPKYAEEATIATANEKTSLKVEENTEVTDDAVAKYVMVDAGDTVTIKPGKTLEVKENLVFKDATSQLVVDKGATVIVGNEIVTASTNNIALTIDDKNKDYSNLLVSADELQESHPKATVGFTTKCKQTPTKYIWQRFAVPTYAKYAVTDIVRPDGVKTAICYYDEATSSWVNLQLGDTLQPFRCYSLTTTETEDGVEYTFPCELVGNGNPVLTLNAGWNYFANAYTAPMSLRDWLVDLMISDDYVIDEQRIIDGAVWVQAPSTRWNNFNAIDVLDEDFEEDYPDYAKLQPMQAFVYYSNVATTIPLKYKEYVYDPLVKNKHISLAAGAPRRRVALEDNFFKATISIKDENGDEELLRVYEGAQFTEDFDEDFDVYKLMNDDFFNAYFATPLGDLSRIALSNLDSTSFTFKTFEAGEFTMSFKSVTLEDYAVKDNLTGTVTELKKGNEYQFSGDANQLYSNRFIILKNGSATAVENVETTQTKKGVYTLTGQYVGKDLNSLPAGVYVVNGKKVVR